MFRYLDLVLLLKDKPTSNMYTIHHSAHYCTVCTCHPLFTFSALYHNVFHGNLLDITAKHNTVDRVRNREALHGLPEFKMNHKSTSIYKTATLLTQSIGDCDSRWVNLGFKYLICVKNKKITSLSAAAGGTALKLRGTPAGG